MSIEKARKRAQRLIEIRQLQPPVDVESLLKGYATVEEIEYPFDYNFPNRLPYTPFPQHSTQYL